MKILFVGKGHLNNDYAGVDGGSNIRIPLINELVERHKCVIEWASYDLNADLQHSNIDFLNVSPYIESCMHSVSGCLSIHEALERVESSDTSKQYDALVIEVRPSWMYKEAYLQNLLIESALKNKIAVLLLDQDLWADSAIDVAFRQHVRLMRPYEVCNPLFSHQEFYPYFYHSFVRDERDPIYDVVYIGNRYERDIDFIDFMRPLHEHGLKVLVSGDWVMKAPYVVREFPKFHWVGSTKHSYTLPLLQLGKCTVHIGRRVMRQQGLTPIRPFEAYMARRVCCVLKYNVSSVLYRDPNVCKVESAEEVVAALSSDTVMNCMREAQDDALRSCTVSHAAHQLVNAICSQQELMKL